MFNMCIITKKFLEKETFFCTILTYLTKLFMPEALKQLISSIWYLPGIWENRATKLAFFLLNANQNYVDTFCDSMQNIKDKIHTCSQCFSLTDTNRTICHICDNDNRDPHTIAVVEEYLDMLTLEESWIYKWKYHILGGAISPINGIFIADLKFRELFSRIEKSEKNLEIILATNPNIEGEATSSYIKEQIEIKKLKHKVKVTRLSRGLSSGYIEYADNITLVNALKERREI